MGGGNLFELDARSHQKDTSIGLWEDSHSVGLWGYVTPPPPLPATATQQQIQVMAVWKAVKPFVNGGLSGMGATCIIQPIDMVKVRIQLGAKGSMVRRHARTHARTHTCTHMRAPTASGEH